MAAPNKNTSALLNQFSPNFASSDSSSPGSTAPRRPPRSKHDLALSVGNGYSPASPNIIRKGTNKETNISIQDALLPSKEAPSRLLIGTQMLQSNQNNKYYLSNHSSKSQPPLRYQNHSNGIYTNKQNDVDMATNMKSIIEDVSYYLHTFDILKCLC